MKIFICLLALIMSTLPADTYTVRGAGASPCAEFNNGVAWAEKVHWVLGFISGAEAVLKPQITAGTQSLATNNQIIEMVNAWCKNRPFDDLASAAQGVADYLNK